MLLNLAAVRSVAHSRQHPSASETSFHPAPDSIAPCTKPGCAHHIDSGTGPIPGLIWPSPGCFMAWQQDWTATHCPELVTV